MLSRGLCGLGLGCALGKLVSRRNDQHELQYPSGPGGPSAEKNATFGDSLGVVKFTDPHLTDPLAQPANRTATRMVQHAALVAVALAAVLAIPARCEEGAAMVSDSAPVAPGIAGFHPVRMPSPKHA